MKKYLLRIKKYLKPIYIFARNNRIRLFSLSPILSWAYYSFLSSSFLDEFSTVIRGMRMNLEEVQIPDNVHYGLRRNVHRLEKALLMRPRKNIFAHDYIGETVMWYENCVKSEHMSNDDELDWAYDVLEEYFQVVQTDSLIERAKVRFFSLPQRNSVISKHTPYRHGMIEKASLDYETFYSLAQQRRSVRWYIDKPVPRDIIDKAIALAALSPSACNRQPFEYRILDDPLLIEEVGSIVPGVQGFEKNIKGLVLVIGKLRAYFHERDRHLIYVDGALSSMAFMFALETLGVSSCGINWPDIRSNNKKITRLLHLQPDERIILLISLGFADPEGMVACSPKKSIDLLRHYNYDARAE